MSDIPLPDETLDDGDGSGGEQSDSELEVR